VNTSIRLKSQGLKSRGQVMVLACVTMLSMALMLMLSFNLSNAIHEKIRVQSHADAQAYSVALIEARAYNTLAYTNRAIAAAFVAQTGLHAWLAIASEAVSIHEGFRNSFFMVAGIELCICLCGCPYACQFPHCKDAFQAFKIAMKHNKAARQVGQKIKSHESDFNNAVKGISTLVDALHYEQIAVVGLAAKEIASVSSTSLKKLKENNAPASEYGMAADAFNLAGFMCPLEGVPGGGTGSCGGSSSSAEDRGKIMQSVANGTRTSFTASSNIIGAMGSIHWDFIPMSQYLQDMQGNEGLHVFVFDIAAGIGNSFNRDPPKYTRMSKVGGSSQGGIGVFWRHGVGGWMLSSDAYSDQNSGRHRPSGAHQGQHGEFPGCLSNDCFVNFKPGDEGSDYNQPSTYGAVSQDLRWTINGQQKNWEVTQSGTVNMKMGDVGEVNLNLVARDKGFAVSKGKTYFHQLDDWSVAPNMFDPFWRAKLHGFDDRVELAKIAATTGDPSIGLIGPVEGK
jgi:hypothetical protein